MWATGPRGTVDGFAYYHAKRTPNLQTTLQFGRTLVDNCGTPPSCMVVQVCPYAQEYLDERDKNSTFVAEIGQSGGNRGYQALTGVSTLDLSMGLLTITQRGFPFLLRFAQLLPLLWRGTSAHFLHWCSQLLWLLKVLVADCMQGRVVGGVVGRVVGEAVGG